LDGRPPPPSSLQFTRCMSGKSGLDFPPFPPFQYRGRTPSLFSILGLFPCGFPFFFFSLFPYEFVTIGGFLSPFLPSSTPLEFSPFLDLMIKFDFPSSLVDYMVFSPPFFFFFFLSPPFFLLRRMQGRIFTPPFFFFSLGPYVFFFLRELF